LKRTRRREKGKGGRRGRGGGRTKIPGRGKPEASTLSDGGYGGPSAGRREDKHLEKQCLRRNNL